ncbi:MAG: hypothetical protein SPL73_05725 [Cyanobacteriota bacterium]|nr:hypothetical protein [Cyanobacteriota bacterium]MDY6364371.1 hypothetical protein [Cyanobacteriota bacterium]
MAPFNTSIPKNNFSSGQIDRDIKSRVDLPLFQNGFEISRNFFHTIKGDCYYRTGFEFLEEIGYSALYEFRFSQEQAYLLVFTRSEIKFWSYNANNELVRVLDDKGNPYTLNHPYGNEIFNLNMTQNCDVLYINHNNGKFPEYQLKRTASNKFALEKTVFTNTGTASLSSNSETENHGYPCTCAFYENRLNRCSSSKYPTYLYGSKGADYNNITVGTNTNDGYQFDLAEANSKALWLESGVNSLLVGTAEGILTVNGGSVTKAITPTDISAKLSCRDGVGNVKPIHKDNFVFFVSSNKRSLYMFEYDVLMEQFKSTNLSKGNYEITKGGIKKLANKFDRFGLIFALCGTRLISICFSNDEAINSWSEFVTKGDFTDICAVTRPDGDYDLFANIKRTINGETKYYLERLTETVEFSRFDDFVSDVKENAAGYDIQELKKNDKYAFYRKIAEELRDCNYLDCSMKYTGLHTSTINLENNVLTSSNEDFAETDTGKRIWYKTVTGREYGILDIKKYISPTQVEVEILLNPTDKSTSQWYLSATHFSGLEHLEGETVSVVGNGGYIGDFVVNNGQIDISNANVNKVGTAIIGLKYKGILKSPNLGLTLQGTQTFTNMKNVYKIGLEMCFSSGGKVGTDLYSLSEVQDFNPEGLYDVPPLPMDEYKEIEYSDTYEKEKHYFVVQDSPLPFHLTAIIPYYKHVSKT